MSQLASCHRTADSLTAEPRLLLIGNPNVGKSLIFGYLTNRYVTVSNYPGTTVEITTAKAVDFNVRPFVAIWETTRACDLSCVHCRAAAQSRRSQFELTTEQGFTLINQIAELKPKVFVITGGDPLKRDDIYDTIHYAKSVGLEPS